MSIHEIGCCGAYCKTCKVFNSDLCKGCKLGYTTSARDISKARCKIKVCCITNKLNTCADCSKYYECSTIQTFHNHDGYKYKKYKQAIEYINDNGYDEFIKISDKWNNAYGKYL